MEWYKVCIFDYSNMKSYTFVKFKFLMWIINLLSYIPFNAHVEYSFTWKNFI
jgi:hypothetical protein